MGSNNSFENLRSVYSLDRAGSRSARRRRVRKRSEQTRLVRDTTRTARRSRACQQASRALRVSRVGGVIVFASAAQQLSNPRCTSLNGRSQTAASTHRAPRAHLKRAHPAVRAAGWPDLARRGVRNRPGWPRGPKAAGAVPIWGAGPRRAQTRRGRGFRKVRLWRRAGRRASQV